MTLLNRDVFATDPTGRKLPNDGVTALDKPSTPTEIDVLTYELESFVAQGEYREGLRRILNSYVTQLDQGVQPAVWVSGFYGSGKSHFLRVLTYLWANPEVNGASARSLVDPPSDVAELLKELDSYGQRVRAVPFAAAGVMRRGKGSSAAQPLLEIILNSANLPTEYAPATFSLWLKEVPGRYEQFLAALAARGKGQEEIMRNLFVSTPIREALLEVVPGFAESPSAAATLIAAEFRTKDVSDDMVIDTIRRVLESVARESKYPDSQELPLTLLVLDELQQYISDDVQMLLEIQNLVERLTRQFQGKLLVVAAGQSALSANDVLARFMDRFTVQVQLQSKDVDTVVREVVLRKKPEQTPTLEDALNTVSGEISKHLAGSKMAAKAADKPDLVPDYPLLPTRRRFMESVLRAVDRGAAGQLRSQLRVTLEAVAEVAGEDIGNVVPADVVYRSKKTDMVNQGVLLGDLEARISAVRDGTAEGDLKARAVELVFLISHLDDSEGVRPTIDTLADLLVTDLNPGSSSLRQALPQLLASLDGDLLVLDGDEYRLQSPEDAEWERAYRAERSRFLNNTSEQVQARNDALRRALERELNAVRITQGATNTPRKWRLHFATDAPTVDDTELTVWIQNGWDQTQAKVISYAQQAGIDDSGVYVWLPKQDDQDFKNAVANERAARSVVSTQPPPTTDQGQQARDGMNGRATRAQERIDELARKVLANASVYLGGGSQPSSPHEGLNALVRSALDSAVVRKFSEFAQADHPGWHTVFKRAKEGNSDALKAVGHDGDVLMHPVVARILKSLDQGQRSGLGILKEFQAAPYGWPKDTVNGALAVLVQSEHVEAHDGANTESAANLIESGMGKLRFSKLTTVLTFAQKQRLKKLATNLSVAPDSPDLGVPASLNALKAAAAAAGGSAPLPAPPDTANIERLLGRMGADRQAAVADKVDDLLADLDAWRKIVNLIPERQAEWQQAQGLLRHATPLPIHDECQATLEAVKQQRSLLTDPNPVRPVIQRLEGALRDAVSDAHAAAARARSEAIDKLSSQPDWAQLPESEREGFLSQHGLAEPPSPNVAEGTSLLGELDQLPLAARQEKAMAYTGKVNAAAADLRKRFTPEAKTVRPQPATLTTEAAANAYVDDLRAEILGHIAAGSPVAIQN